MVEIVSFLPSFVGLYFWAGTANLKTANIIREVMCTILRSLKIIDVPAGPVHGRNCVFLAQFWWPILLGLTPGPQEGQVPSLCRLDDRCTALLLLSDIFTSLHSHICFAPFFCLHTCSDKMKQV